MKKIAALGVREIVLECVPETVGTMAQQIFTQNTDGEGVIIGIGAGRNVKGQVLVFDDVIGKTSEDFQPKFLKRYAKSASVAHEALSAFCTEVRERKFPGEGNVY